MRLDQMLYRLTYRAGSPRWDTGLPRPELADLVNGRAPGGRSTSAAGPEPMRFF
jgi:hypothetical protein